MLRFLFKAAALILGSFSPLGRDAANAATDNSNAYRLEAQFDPVTGALSVKGTLDVVADRRTESIRLLLNDALTVRSFKAGGNSAKVEPIAKIGAETVPGAQGIIVPLTKPLEAGERLRMRFAYDGRLTTENIKVGRGVVSPGWTELTYESFWYPLFLRNSLSGPS
jgi:hypothetical protein